MVFYYVQDCETQVQFNIFWCPGKYDFGDYHTKQHSPTHQILMRFV